MIPPNYRLINDTDANLETREDPNINCLSCSFYSEQQNEGFCAKYQYRVMAIHHEEIVTGIVSNAYVSVPITQKQKIYDSPKTICDFYLSHGHMKKSFNISCCSTLLCVYPIIMLLIMGISIAIYGDASVAGSNSAPVVLIAIPSIFLGVWYFNKKSQAKAMAKNSELIQNHEQRITQFLNEEYVLPMGKIYQILRINGDELMALLNTIPSHLYRVNDSQILIDNHFRVDFLTQLDNAYQI